MILDYFLLSWTGIESWPITFEEGLQARSQDFFCVCVGGGGGGCVSQKSGSNNERFE